MKGNATVEGLVLLLALGSAVLAQAPTAGGKPETRAAAPPQHEAVEKAIAKSESAIRRGDFQTALNAATEAVDLDPKDPAARLARAILLQRLQGAGTTAEMNQQIDRMMREDYRAAAETDPDSTAAGIARDALAGIEGRQVFPDTEPACPKEALAEFDAAEELFGTNHLKDSLDHFEKAAKGCPDDPKVWTHYGDVYYALEDLAQARSRFEKAVAKGPWYAQGHRFLADTLVRQGQFEAAYHQAVLAVLADPTYEAGWGGLRSYVTSRGGTWKRVYGAKPEIQSGSAGKEKTALERERAAIRAVLASRREKAAPGAKPPAASPFWDMMAGADQAGFLDEAIFVHLLDRDLLPEYKAYRDKSRDRLVRYVETVLAPLPPAPAAP